MDNTHVWPLINLDIYGRIALITIVLQLGRLGTELDGALGEKGDGIGKAKVFGDLAKEQLLATAPGEGKITL